MRAESPSLVMRTTNARPTEEVQCPRVTQAAIIAAAMFGSRRSGISTNGSVGSGLLGRISEAWPPLAPPGGCPRLGETSCRT
jgi:hypothetical protein